MFSDYIGKLGQLLNSIECSDGRRNISPSQGINIIVEWLIACRRDKQKIMWVGNGGSAAIASHSAIDYWRTGSIKSVAFNDPALLTCIGNDFGYESVFAKPLSLFAESEDVLFAISSSGQSKNITNAVKVAKDTGGKVITLSGFKADNPLRTAGDINFYVPSNHYGHVELVHSVLCHGFLDLFMAKQAGGRTW